MLRQIVPKRPQRGTGTFKAPCSGCSLLGRRRDLDGVSVQLFQRKKKKKPTNQNMCFLERLQGRVVTMNPEHGEGMMPISA